MYKKKIITVGELKRRIQSIQLVRINNKLTVKIVKTKNTWDFRIDRLDLPIDLYFHTLNINLSLPPKTHLSIKIRDIKTKHLINEGIIPYQNGTFTGKISFYTDQRNISVIFRLIGTGTTKSIDIGADGRDGQPTGRIDGTDGIPDGADKSLLNKLYYIHKIILESTLNLNPKDLKISYSEKTDVLKVPDIPTRDIRKFLGNEIFNYIKLINFEITNNIEGDLKNIVKLRNEYFNLISAGLLSLFITSSNFGPMIFYNLVYYINNCSSGHLHIKNSTILNVKKNTELGSVETVENRLVQNRESMERLIESYERTVAKRLKVHERLIQTKDSFENYSTQYTNNLAELKESLHQQENFNKRDIALEKSAWELEKLESLKEDLLKELNKVKKIKGIFDTGLSKTETSPHKENLFTKQFSLILSGLYQEIGKDVLRIDEKIQDYSNVLDYFKNNLSNSEVYQEQKRLQELARDNGKRITILKERHEEYQEKVQDYRIRQYQILGNLICLKIENCLLDDYKLHIAVDK